jgi:hypothetical protein
MAAKLFLSEETVSPQKNDLLDWAQPHTKNFHDVAFFKGYNWTIMQAETAFC